MTVRDESKEQSKDVNRSLLRHPVPSSESPLIHSLVSSLHIMQKTPDCSGELAGNYFLDYERKGMGGDGGIQWDDGGWRDEWQKGMDPFLLL